MYHDPLHAKLQPAVQRAFQELFGHDLEAKTIAFQHTRPEFEGDVTINVFPFLKLSGKGPEQTATAIGEHLQREVPEVARFNVVKGFLNVVIADAYWTDFLQEAGERDILQFPSTGEQVMVEYSSPNTNKPLHLGHLRNNFLGHSVSRILQASGHEVVRVQIINDRGIHICKSMVAWQRFGNGETPASSGLKGDKLVGKYYVEFDKAFKQQVQELEAAGTTKEAAEKEAPILLEAQDMLRRWEANDPEVRALWAQMNGWVYEGFNATYTRMGVEFDKLYYESDTYVLGKEDVLKGLESGVFYRKDDGSVWVDNTDSGLDEKVLLRGDGTSLYMTQDIGTAIRRFAEYPLLKQLIYVVGNEQDYHFKVLFIILKKLGFTWADGLHHLSYGMVDLPSGKMKSREGTVVDADDLIEEVVQEARTKGEELSKLDDFTPAEKDALFEIIGLAALKYFLLKVDPKKRMLFDPAASIDLQGHTGPFIQYTYARIASLRRKIILGMSLIPKDWLGAKSIPEMNVLPIPRPESIEPIERELLKTLHQGPSVLNEAAHKLDPSQLANYVYDLAKSFNSFYQTVPVAKEVDQGKAYFRYMLSLRTGEVIKKAMWCLGIEVPERM